MEPIIAPTQYITVALFLALMLGVLWLVRRYQKPLSAKFAAHQRITVHAVTPITPHERAVILCVDGMEYLTIVSKHGASQMTALPPRPAPQAPTEDAPCA